MNKFLRLGWAKVVSGDGAFAVTSGKTLNQVTVSTDRIVRYYAHLSGTIIEFDTDKLYIMQAPDQLDKILQPVDLGVDMSELDFLDAQPVTTPVAVYVPEPVYESHGLHIPEYPPDLIGIKEAATLAKRSIHSVRGYVYSKAIKGHKKEGKKALWVSKSELQAYMATRKPRYTKKWVTIKEAAEEFNCTTGTIRYRILTNKFETKMDHHIGSGPAKIMHVLIKEFHYDT